MINAALRCWGYGGDGRLGLGDTASIGDDDDPVGSVDFGPGRSVTAVSAGDFHTCALLDNASVGCWGFGANGRLGYGDTLSIGDDESPGSVGPIGLGAGRTAKAISAGGGHSCAILTGDDSVRCWGFNAEGRLGYGNTDTIGDNEPAGAGGPVKLGVGRSARAISAGGFHTCALLDDGNVRCWGFAGSGRLGYPILPFDNSTPPRPVEAIGRTPETTPDTIGPVVLGKNSQGVNLTAVAISSGTGHTCALLSDGNVRCWGSPASGRLGYGNSDAVGDNEDPGAVPPVFLGTGRTAVAISAGDEHTCAILDEGSVRCWGYGGWGALGYGDIRSIGDNELPGSVGAVNLGPGRTATAISAGTRHTCARLDDASVRCWGYGAHGRLGYCNQTSIGDDESPATAGPVQFGLAGIPGAGCPVAPVTPPPPPPPPAPGPGDDAALLPAPAAPAAPGADPLDAALSAQGIRAAAFRGCRQGAARTLAAARRRARELAASRRRSTLRVAGLRAASQRRACVLRHGRAPGRVTTLAARAQGSGKVALTFQAAGTDGSKLPAAQRYLIKQSPRPIRSARDFDRAPSLCKGTCSFNAARTGASLTLTITDLRRGVYYYAIRARDNVSGRMGPRSRTISVRAR